MLKKKIKQKKKPILKYVPSYGSKRRMVRKLRKMIPEHEKYVELFAGSGALLLNHERSKVEIINDKAEEISNLFEVMVDREKGRQFINAVKSMNYDKDIFEAVKCAKKQYFHEFTQVEKAVLQYYLLTTSFNATGKQFAKGRFDSDEEYRKRVCKYLEDVYQRLEGVEVLNLDAIELLKIFVEDENAFLFMDPPYVKSLRGKGAGNVYAYEMELREHIEMLKTIQNAKAKIMLCGYWMGEADIYDSFLLPYRWKRIFVGNYPKSAQRKKDRDIGSEYIWLNYSIPIEIEKNFLKGEFA